MTPIVAAAVARRLDVACGLVGRPCAPGVGCGGAGYGGVVVMTVVFQAEDEPVVSRRDYWQEVVRGLLAPLELRMPRGDFRSRVTVTDVGPAQVLDLVTTRGQALRTPRLIRRSDPGLCKIDVLVRGRLVVEQGGRQAELRPGDFAVVDLSRPCRWVNDTAASSIALSFPRALLPLKDGELGALTGVAMPGDRGTTALISSLARQLPATLDGCRSEESARLGAAVLDLLCVVLAARVGRGDGRPAESRGDALLVRVQGYIERRLGDPALSPGSIAGAHHISLRRLYTLFEGAESGVAGWIRRRRLERCRRDLLDPALRSRPVSAIAARWGLTNPAHFSRAFRAAYGVPPAEFRRLGGGAGGPAC
ncbi:helix-turn-helix domain-containing protein [Nonomuraea sp. MTCD27]|uniref:AraC-like ligand-binding domain-containing protein n=1 Tax=Nonomuraea sp. MTCD27 TaxID=1676747 RepID=UPI0035C03BB9